MIESMLKRYDTPDADAYYQALREVMQEIALAGLYRGGFFNKAAFYGGTALRIFHGLERFSEDLDFSLLEKNPDFSLELYFQAINTEFKALGISVDIKAKRKTKVSAIESAFLKGDTRIHELQIQGMYQQSWNLNRPIKIKFEVDTQPPLGFDTEEKLLLQPFSFYVKCYGMGDLFAGKLHALLYRSWKNRVKGRDWYDFEWYVRNGHSVHLSHFLIRAHESGQLTSIETIDISATKTLMHERIEQIDFEQAKTDVLPFLKEVDSLKVWSQDYFHGLTEKLR